MGLVRGFARWLAMKAAVVGGWNISVWQGNRPYYPDTSHRSLIDKYIGWVYACANKNAISCAQIPLRLYAAKPTKGSRSRFATKALDHKQAKYLYSSPTCQRYIAKAADLEEVQEHPFLDLLANVNEYMNGFDLLESLFLSQEITGNAFWYIVKNETMGLPQEIWPLFTQHIKIIPHKTKFIDHYEFSVDNIEKHIIKPEDMVQFKYTSLKDAFWGMGPLQACVIAADLSTGMNSYEAYLMENRAHPDFAIVLPEESGTPSQEHQERVEKAWYKKFRGKTRAGKPVWLYGGADIKQLSLSPKELSFLQGRKATLNEMAAVFGVPMSELTTENVNRANAEAGEYSWMKNTILPRLRKVEQKLNEKLLPMYDESLFCAFDNPVPEDKEFRLKQTESHLKTGYAPINEVRQNDGLDEVEWGNVPILPTTLAPLGSQTAPVAPESPKAPIKGKTTVNKAPRTLPPLGHPTNFVNEPFVEAMRGYFKSQQTEILQAFDSDMKSLTKSPADDYLSAWFDMQRWNRELETITEPFVRYTFMNGGEQALRQLTTERQFDPLNPRVVNSLINHKANSARQINHTTLKQLRKTLSEGMAENETLIELRKRLENEYEGFDRYKAMVVARTETIWAWNAGAVEGYKQSGMVEKKQWVSSGDERTCGFCTDMDGQIIAVQSAFWDKGDIMQSNGSKLSFEYEEVEHPPMHPMCRCTVVAVIEGV